VFDVNVLGEGLSSPNAWRIFMKSVDPKRIAECTLKYGHTAALEGEKKQFCIAVYGPEAQLSYLREVFGSLQEEALAPLDKRFVVGRPLLDEASLSVKGWVDALGRLVTDEWHGIDHDLCKETRWGYEPQSVPQDLPEDLKLELEQMRGWVVSPIELKETAVQAEVQQQEQAEDIVIYEYEKEVTSEYLDPLRPTKTHEDQHTRGARNWAKELMKQYGELLEVRCEADATRHIVLAYENGTVPVEKHGSMLQYGYAGTGTSCFWAFLDESSFEVPYWFLCEDFKPPVVLKRDAPLPVPMLTRAFQIEAAGTSPEEVRALLQQYIPRSAENVKWRDLGEHAVGRSGPSDEIALQEARAAVPSRALITAEKIISPKTSEKITKSIIVESYSEDEAKRSINAQPSASVVEIETLKTPKKSLLGIVREKGTYEVVYEAIHETPAKAEVTYVLPISVQYTLPPERRFFFECGEGTSTIEELIKHSRKHRGEAKEHLSQGHFEAWLCDKWAEVCKLVRQEEQDEDVQLELFMVTVESAVKRLRQEKTCGVLSTRASAASAATKKVVTRWGRPEASHLIKREAASAAIVSEPSVSEGIQVKVRLVSIADAKAIAAIGRDVGWFAYLAQEPKATTEASIAKHLELCGADESHAVLIAENESCEVIGYVTVHWLPCLMLSGQEAYISELFVAESERGKGVGRKLLDAAKERALERGCTRLTLLNGRHRASYTRGFYTKLGWKERPEIASFVLPLMPEK
jgi:GNAT superfamily N-acetyltransferase